MVSLFSYYGKYKNNHRNTCHRLFIPFVVQYKKYPNRLFFYTCYITYFLTTSATVLQINFSTMKGKDYVGACKRNLWTDEAKHSSSLFGTVWTNDVYSGSPFMSIQCLRWNIIEASICQGGCKMILRPWNIVVVMHLEAITHLVSSSRVLRWKGSPFVPKNCRWVSDWRNRPKRILHQVWSPSVASLIKTARCYRLSPMSFNIVSDPFNAWLPYQGYAQHSCLVYFIYQTI